MEIILVIVVISLGILFHANSPFSWSFEPAYHTAYKPAVNIISQFDVKINWHFSAPLLQMLNWKYPKLIDIIIRGIDDDRYEVLSSSYAQNVMFATSDWANQYHLELNKSFVSDIFNFDAKGFWNPERVWSDKFVDWILDIGYEYTLIENKIINPTDPESANQLYVKYRGDDKLFILPDNQDFLELFDSAIWTGEIDPMINYLKELNQSSDDTVVVYAQDSENLGYWQLAHPDVDTDQIYKNLEKIISTLLDLDWINIQTFSEIINSHTAVEIGKMQDGQATWMLNSVRYDGYQDYFDYLNTAPEIIYFKNLFQQLEAEIQQYENDRAHTDLFQEALSSYLAHQFEFGCATGSLGSDETRYLVNVPGRMILEGTRLATQMLKAFDSPVHQLKWSYMGNHPVIIFSNEHVYSIWTPYGGRCVMLIDRDKQTMISPNPYYYNVGNSVADLELPSPTFEFPNYGSTIIHGGTLLADTLEVNGEAFGTQAVTKRVFSEHGAENIFSASLPHNYYDTQVIPFDNEIKFWIRLGSYLLMKKVSIIGKDINVSYTISSEKEGKDVIKFGIANEVSPSPNEIMIGGTNVLDIELGTISYTVYNVATGAGLEINPSSIPTNTDVIEAFFAKRLSLYFSGKIWEDQPLKLDFKLSVI